MVVRRSVSTNTTPVVGATAWRMPARTTSRSTVELEHTFTPGTISDDALVAVLNELVRVGDLHGQLEFEAAAVAIIESSHTTSILGWESYYTNSLRSLNDGTASFAPIHRQARELVQGQRVLEVGACFGFLAMQLACDGYEVTACDISPGAISLLTDAARRLSLEVAGVVADATELGFADNSFDTVTLIHLLEHLTEDQARVAIDEALRVATRRVVIAVPYESHPSEHFGHIVTVTRSVLQSWSETALHAGAHIFELHGGWLVLEPISARGTNTTRGQLLPDISGALHSLPG